MTGKGWTVTINVIIGLEIKKDVYNYTFGNEPLP